MVARAGRVSYSKAGGTGQKQLWLGLAPRQEKKSLCRVEGVGHEGYLRETETWDLSPRLSGEAPG